MAPQQAHRFAGGDRRHRCSVVDRFGRARREAARGSAARPPDAVAAGGAREDLGDLLPLALACFLLGAVETAAIGRMFAEKHGYRLDSNQEFLALSPAPIWPQGSARGFRSAAACRNRWSMKAAALLGVLWAGLLKGALIGAVISLVLLLRRASSPHVAFLGRIPGARRYSDLKRHADNEPIPGVLAFRVESSIVYFNADHVLDSVLARLEADREPIRLVLCDLSTSPNIDLVGARMLRSLQVELA